MGRCVFFVGCKKNGEVGISYYDDATVGCSGGLNGIVEVIHQNTAWYSPLGEGDVPESGDDTEVIKRLFDVWIDKGAPTLKGAHGTGPETGATPTLAKRYSFYKTCDEEGCQQVIAYSEAEIEAYGGVEAIEKTLCSHHTQFYPLDSLLWPYWLERASDGSIDDSDVRIKGLVDEWIEKGSPWKPGTLTEHPEARPTRDRLSEEEPEADMLQSEGHSGGNAE